jgi:cell wall-associated NlpC family hydrolase
VQTQQVQWQAQLNQAQATLTSLIGAKAAADQQAAAEAAAQQAADDAARKAADDASNDSSDDSTPNNTSDAGPGSSSAAQTAIAAAKRWLGTPYAWGGGSLTGPSRGIGIDAGVVGFDCSGLTRYAYYQAGIRIPRNSTAQYAALPKVSRANLQPGDLVFYAFDTSNPATIHHVAIYLGGDQILEAPESGKTVRITAMRWGSYIGAARPGA